jgi:hypothetical protein
LANFERSRNELDPRGKTFLASVHSKKKKGKLGYWLVKFEECFCSFLFFSFLPFSFSMETHFAVFFVALKVAFFVCFWKKTLNHFCLVEDPPVIFLDKTCRFFDQKNWGDFGGKKLYCKFD